MDGYTFTTQRNEDGLYETFVDVLLRLSFTHETEEGSLQEAEDVLHSLVEGARFDGLFKEIPYETSS